MKKVNKKKATSNATTKATATKTPKTGKAKAEPKGLNNLKEDLKDKNAKSAKQEVISMREVKYKYPEDIAKDPMAKKSWRQRTRNKIESLESKIFNAKGDDKLTKELTKELNAFKEEVYN